MIIRTGCGHHFDTTAGISEPSRAGWADEIARLAARDPGSAGCLSGCPACGTEQVLVRVADERVIAGLTMSDSLNTQHEFEGSDVAAGHGNRANPQGQVGLALSSSSEEEAGEPFRTGCPLSVALRSRSLPNAVRRSRHSGQSRDSLSRSLSPLTCSNVRSSVNREYLASAGSGSGAWVSTSI